MVIMSGRDRVDTSSLARTVGAKEIRRADAESVKRATGYPIGGVSPAGLPAGVKVLVDNGLALHDLIWAAAGTPHAVYPTTFEELLRLTGGRPADVRESETI